MHAQFLGNEMYPSGSEKEVKLADFTLVKQKFFVSVVITFSQNFIAVYGEPQHVVLCIDLTRLIFCICQMTLQQSQTWRGPSQRLTTLLSSSGDAHDARKHALRLVAAVFVK